MQIISGRIEETWLRRESESDPAFEAFETYLNMGLSRSLVKAAAALGKSEPLLAGWSVKHEWRRRVTDYDRHQSREVNRMLAAGKAAMMQRQARTADLIASRAAERIMAMTPQDIASLHPVQAALLFKTATEIAVKMHNVAEDQTESQPFQVVVNTLQSADETEKLMELAMRSVEPASNVIPD